MDKDREMTEQPSIENLKNRIIYLEKSLRAQEGRIAKIESDFQEFAQASAYEW